ncbi:hypothetical protein DM860_009746 [Cuscuta australis]|uniref:Uncharacterized protein n=1 Tax=Cuscuta australis TaxID=267555 RepID=A0A328DBU7_9ASTE|nr:hypothetical protein DM860_009746 [Cuscuta australis]
MESRAPENKNIQGIIETTSSGRFSHEVTPINLQPSYLSRISGHLWFSLYKKEYTSKKTIETHKDILALKLLQSLRGEVWLKSAQQRGQRDLTQRRDPFYVELLCGEGIHARREHLICPGIHFQEG